MFKCECGREFENGQSFNGHKSHCKVHQLAKHGTLDILISVQQKKAVKAHKTLLAKQEQKKLQAKVDWAAEQHVCEACGKIMTEKFGSGRFCSRACACRRQISTTQREKVATTLKNKPEHEVACSKCGQLFKTRDFSRKLCYDCQPKTIKYANTTKSNLPKDLGEVSNRTKCKILQRMEVPCLCCGFYMKGISLDLHHIYPRHLHGGNELSNLTYICPNCHRIVHTPSISLPNKLRSLEDYFTEHKLNWLDYYYIKKK